MKSKNVNFLDEKDEEIANTLVSLGISRPVARSLSYLHNLSEATSFDLEKGTRLRQPEVSIAMKGLKDRKWINEREEKKPGKGRPYKIYSLKVDFDDIITLLEKQKMKAVEDTHQKIERLKELEKH